MLPGQPLATPAVDSAPAPVDATLSALSRGAALGATTDNADELLPGDAKKAKRMSQLLAVVLIRQTIQH